MSETKIVELDYRQTKAADALLPKSSVISSSSWRDLHLEVFQEPKFEIAEHQHTMHVIAHSPAASRFSAPSTGERWLDSKVCHETRYPGEIAVIPAGIAHRCNWNTSVEFMVLAIAPTLLQHMGQDIVDQDRIELIPQFMNQVDPLIQGIFQTLKEELEFGKLGGDLLVDSCKTTLAIHLLRNYCTTRPKQHYSENGLSRSKLKQIQEYIDQYLHRDLKLVELSAIAQLSPYYFLRLFKEQTGMTPHQYILQQRIQRAKTLLQHNQLSIADIAARTGFSDQSHLTKCFKRRLGITPMQFLQR